MLCLMSRKLIVVFIAALYFSQLYAQKFLPFKLPDTGQTGNYTSTHGEDSDFIINPSSFTDNKDGTITDNITGLMWQKTDGGEMIFENASSYCKNLKLAGYNDWRLPTSIELFSINNYDNLNPALNSSFFSKTNAEYWWTNEKRADDSTKVWVVNAGGGIGAHPITETISAGGVKYFNVRVVRNPFSTTFSVAHFTDNGNGTISDNYTGLTWQKIQSSNTMTWEEALAYSNNITLAGKSDWRLPNVRELQSLNDPRLILPSFNKNYFTNVLSGNYWSSTTLYLTSTKAWDINIDYGIVSYDDKTLKQNILLVRGGLDNNDLNISEVLIPAGEFIMGDHYGFGGNDPNHPSDELPLHDVKINSLYVAKYVTTNQQFLAFLNSSLLNGLIEVRSNIVYATGRNDIYCYTNQYASNYSIGYDGKVFSIVDFRSNHPVVGVMWFGAAAFCNWLSAKNGMHECYNPTTWICDFTINGYRLLTEAEWEYAARGGQYNPYYNYPWGNDLDTAKANWPDSKDPYEGTTVNTYPYTTPVGFYNGQLHFKSDYNWPGSVVSYQTSNGANAFGLYDMAGNVWEFVYDWYVTNYYSTSPTDNPKGPDSGSLMPDGKPYRCMRGGCWYNGDIFNSINDGHSRVSNRDPSYYRGPLDPAQSWNAVGFRIARNYNGNTTGINKTKENVPMGFMIYQNYPNPFNPTTTIKFELPKAEFVVLQVYNSLGQLTATLLNERLETGSHSCQWKAGNFSSGIYFCRLQLDNQTSTIKMILIK